MEIHGCNIGMNLKRAETFKSIVMILWILTNHKWQKEEQTNHQHTSHHHHYSRDTISVLRGRECFQGWLRINMSPSSPPPSPLSLPPPCFSVYLTILSLPSPRGWPLPDWYNRLKMGHICYALLLLNDIQVCHSAWSNRLRDHVNFSLFIRLCRC